MEIIYNEDIDDDTHLFILIHSFRKRDSNGAKHETSSGYLVWKIYEIQRLKSYS